VARKSQKQLLIEALIRAQDDGYNTWVVTNALLELRNRGSGPLTWWLRVHVAGLMMDAGYWEGEWPD
jgi:phosphatidylserine/phosphatidylglycerophosphate/cardiolipin synthase-like enzyme